ncbi:hypothetical protein D1007_51746 [Hordeum vulgare]|nr:hypothetical protein D1007_51746 [Hordeum vulgare]
MVEHGLNANHMMITEFTSNHKMGAIDIGKHLSRLYDRVDQLQVQIYDLQNQIYRCAPPDALRLAIQLSEREAAKEAAMKAKVARHAKEQDRLLRRLSGMRCSSDEDDSDGSTCGSDDDDDDVAPHAAAYMEEGHNCVDDQKGKGSTRKW